jgi:hypothetical protein
MGEGGPERRGPMMISTIGQILSTLYGPVVFLGQAFWRWWTVTRPTRKVLEGIAENHQLLRIFVRDLFVPPGTQLIAREGTVGPQGVVPNIARLWPDVEGKSVAYVLNALGQVYKTNHIEITAQSDDPGLRERNIIVLGAQAQKSYDFYTRMQGVAYEMDANEIRERATQTPVAKETGYGYGIILKARNPHLRGAKSGTALLIGGFGTLGTAAAGYYFRDHLPDLGRKFGRECFGIVLRASVTAGEQAPQRLPQYDRTLRGPFK